MNMSVDEFLRLVKITTQDSFQDVEKCWWANREISCVGMFSNQMLDEGICFTFNPDKSVAHNLVHSGTVFYNFLLQNIF